MKQIILILLTLTILSCNISNNTNKQDLISQEELINDLDFFVKTLEEVHPDPYFYIGRDEFYKKYDIVKSSINEDMSQLSFYKKITPLVVSLGDGHTRVNNSFIRDYMQANNINGIPLKVEVRDGKLYIIEELNDNSIQPGSEILKINGIDSKTIIVNLLQYISAESIQYKEVILEIIFANLFWLHYEIEDDFEIEYMDNSEVKKKTLIGIDIGETINSQNHSYEHDYKIIDDVCYLDFNSFREYNKFHDLLSTMFKEIKEKEIDKLIIDLRGNGGGNSGLGDLLFSYIYHKPFRQFSQMNIKISQQILNKYSGYSKLGYNIGDIRIIEPEFENPLNSDLSYTGKVILLIDRYTFSSATGFSTLFKDYSAGIIIGEETGGMASCFGDLYRYILPNSRLSVGTSFKYFIRPNGLEDNIGVTPDIERSLSIKDRYNDNDSTLNFAIRYFDSNYEEKINEIRLNNDFINK